MRFLSMLVVLALSAGAVACGSSEPEPLSQDAYLKQINAAQTKFAAGAAELDLASPGSAKDFGNSLGQLNGLIDTLRTRFADIEAPEEVVAEQDDLIEQLSDYGGVIERQRGALTSGDPQRAQAAAKKVGKASTTFSQEFDATIAQINADLGLETGSGS